MGTYDTVHDGERYEQVKLWGKGLRHLHVGDRVGLPRGGLGPTGTYTVAMPAGGYVRVVDGIIAGWDDAPGPGPQLTVGGERFDPADWPGGPFGPWYRDADAPPDRRMPGPVDRECPRPGTPRLRIVGDDDPGSRPDRALAAARDDVSTRLASGSDEAGRIGAARAYLADRTSSVHVACEAAAALLGVGGDPLGAGTRLVRLLSSAPDDAPEWSNAAALLARTAADLPAAPVAECLRLLARALPADVPPGTGTPAGPVHAGEHPAIRRRRTRVAADDADDFLAELGRYGDLDFRAAAEAAVARHGAAVLPAVPLRFWGQDIVVAELAVPLLAPVLGRALAPDEEAVALSALLPVPGTLDRLGAGTLTAALRRHLDR